LGPQLVKPVSPPFLGKSLQGMLFASPGKIKGMFGACCLGDLRCRISTWICGVQRQATTASRCHKHRGVVNSPTLEEVPGQWVQAESRRDQGRALGPSKSRGCHLCTHKFFHHLYLNPSWSHGFPSRRALVPIPALSLPPLVPRAGRLWDLYLSSQSKSLFLGPWRWVRQ
jgi:hypothetical protein